MRIEYLIAFAGSAAVLYGLASVFRGQIRTRGSVYVRADSPVGYWLSVISAIAFGGFLVYLALRRLGY